MEAGYHEDLMNLEAGRYRRFVEAEMELSGGSSMGEVP